MSLLDESLATAAELGMRPLIERVIALQKQAESQPTKAPAYPDGLTEREVEVLNLIALGKTNPEIAEALFMSPTNILNKTNTSNRIQAAAYASQHGLV